ncbi:hypothetical protein [Burkholderia dolosa]|uniref:hypothetical protein n=1 Tax=Burkholderia dolosa TaxID=152500 RepID=UPI0027D307F5|nr:hypothetical protein [Burkholderia dolosa]
MTILSQESERWMSARALPEGRLADREGAAFLPATIEQKSALARRALDGRRRRRKASMSGWRGCADMDRRRTMQTRHVCTVLAGSLHEACTKPGKKKAQPCRLG